MQGRVEILLVALCYGNWGKLWSMQNPQVGYWMESCLEGVGISVLKMSGEGSHSTSQTFLPKMFFKIPQFSRLINSKHIPTPEIKK